MGHTLQPGDAQVDENKLADLCRHYGVTELSLFGSAVRGEMRPGSDIDVMDGKPEQHPKESFMRFSRENLLRPEEVAAVLGQPQKPWRTGAASTWRETVEKMDRALRKKAKAAKEKV